MIASFNYKRQSKYAHIRLRPSSPWVHIQTNMTLLSPLIMLSPLLSLIFDAKFTHHDWNPQLICILRMKFSIKYIYCQVKKKRYNTQYVIIIYMLYFCSQIISNTIEYWFSDLYINFNDPSWVLEIPAKSIHAEFYYFLYNFLVIFYMFRPTERITTMLCAVEVMHCSFNSIVVQYWRVYILRWQHVVYELSKPI